MSRSVTVTSAPVGGAWPSDARVWYDFGDSSQPKEGQGTTKSARHTFNSDRVFRIRAQVFTRDMAQIGGNAYVDYDTTSGGGTDPAPVLSHCEPDTGPPEGDTLVYINGSALTGSTGVTFGGVAGLGWQVMQDTTAACRTPAHAAGAVDVSVVGPGGTGTLPNGFTFGTEPPPFS